MAKASTKKTTTRKTTDATASPRAARREALATEQARVAETFADADKKGDPNKGVPAEDIIVGQQVRGY